MMLDVDTNAGDGGLDGCGFPERVRPPDVETLMMLVGEMLVKLYGFRRGISMPRDLSDFRWGHRRMKGDCGQHARGLMELKEI